MMAPTVVTSSQPLACTSCSGGDSSVTSPYLAGEYAAAPTPASANASSGSIASAISAQASAFSPLAASITRALGQRSASAPTQGASSTYARVNTAFNSGASQALRPISASRAMATMSKALSARPDTNCAAIRQAMPRVIER